MSSDHCSFWPITSISARPLTSEDVSALMLVFVRDSSPSIAYFSNPWPGASSKLTSWCSSAESNSSVLPRKSSPGCQVSSQFLLRQPCAQGPGLCRSPLWQSFVGMGMPFIPSSCFLFLGQSLISFGWVRIPASVSSLFRHFVPSFPQSGVVCT
jgi:hypothetical protein